MSDHTFSFSNVQTKYHSRKTTIDGHTFDSQVEANRYFELKQLVRLGEISDLELQPRFVILDDFVYQGKKVRGITYIADFAYTKDGQKIVEDVKGIKTEAYKLKAKLFKARYPEIIFVEIFAK